MTCDKCQYTLLCWSYSDRNVDPNKLYIVVCTACQGTMLVERKQSTAYHYSWAYRFWRCPKEGVPGWMVAKRTMSRPTFGPELELCVECNPRYWIERTPVSFFIPLEVVEKHHYRWRRSILARVRIQKRRARGRAPEYVGVIGHEFAGVPLDIK